MAFQPFTNGIRLALNKSVAANTAKRETQAAGRTRMKETRAVEEIFEGDTR
jgi:hypothetical protein